MFSPLLRFLVYRRIPPVLAASPTVADIEFPLFICVFSLHEIIFFVKTYYGLRIAI